MDPLVTQLKGSLDVIDSALNRFAAPIVVIASKTSVIDPSTVGPVNYIPRVTPFTQVSMPAYVNLIPKHVDPALVRSGDFFMIYEPLVVENVARLKDSHVRIHPHLFLWEMAIKRVWLRVQCYQALIAVFAGILPSEQQKLLLTADEVWDQFSEATGEKCKTAFLEAFERLSDIRNAQVQAHKAVSNLTLVRNGECQVLSVVAMLCGSEENVLDFLKFCRFAAFAKALGPWC